MRSGNGAGIWWMLVSSILFVAVTVVARHLGSDLSAVEGTFLRYVFGLLLIVPVLVWMRKRLLAHVHLSGCTWREACVLEEVCFSGSSRWRAFRLRM